MSDQQANGQHEASYAEESAEALLEQSQQNAQALILATISLLDDLGVLPEAWAEGIGERFSVAWGEEEPWEADEFLDAMLSNYRALGAEIQEARFEPQESSAVVTGFPDDELCELFDIDPASAQVFHRVAGEIARRRDLAWSWSADGDRVTLTVRAEPAAESPGDGQN